MQKRGCLVYFVHVATTLLNDEESAWDVLNIFSLTDSAINLKSVSEKCCKLIKIWQNYGQEFVASLFWPTLYWLLLQLFSLADFKEFP